MASGVNRSHPIRATKREPCHLAATCRLFFVLYFS
nr:MAG TPA: hypothetical protein [Herelleviridae sp.]DAV56380.1 MAG TPA: hypothetical protein [Bacteriophage sp.]